MLVDMKTTLNISRRNESFCVNHSGLLIVTAGRGEE